MIKAVRYGNINNNINQFHIEDSVRDTEGIATCSIILTKVRRLFIPKF